MTSLEARYLPADRLHALSTGTLLPTSADGSALFADISGFTSVTERLRIKLGARRGAEALVGHLNRVYDVLISQVDRHGGSIIGFAGDAITCWFAGEGAAQQATSCGAALLEAMRGVETITLPDGETLLISLKVVIASGTARRYVVGDPDIQLVDTLVGAVVARLASGEHMAERGELLADAQTVALLGGSVATQAWREEDGERFAVLDGASHLAEAAEPSDTSITPPSADLLLPWMLPAFARHLKAGLGEFEIELRPAAVLFLRLAGIDYDRDGDACAKLDGVVRLIQTVVHRYDGSVVQLTIGDKGSYLQVAFGAPIAHEDDALRALNTSLELRDSAATLGYLNPVQIGISRGMMRTGAYGGSTRRTFGVMGDEVNLAARLMERAEPGEILLSESLSSADLSEFTLERLPAMQFKGKANPIGVFRLLQRRDRSFDERFYGTPLVGRNAELAVLHQALQPMFEGRHAGVIWVYGEPGMGKSRLVFEAQKRLQSARAVTWLTGQADALNRAQLGAFAYFLRRTFGQQRDHDHATNLAAFDSIFDALRAAADDTARADLGNFRSFLAGIAGLALPDSPYERLDEKSRIDNGIAAIKAWARAEGSRQPLVLHLEDAQWLDFSSIRAVQQLTYNMENVPLALVLTSRNNDDGTPFTIPNIYSVPITTLDLNRLSNDGVDAVATSIVGKLIGERLARFVHERAEGNPFFAEQLMFDLQERGVLIEVEGRSDIDPDLASEVPSRVNAVLIARLDRLSKQVKSVVQTAAVLGREFEIDVLSRMLRREDTLAVREAEREAIWSALDALRYLFRHALLRDAAYDMQAQERLKALHRLAAEAIEALYPDDVTQHEALLDHWYRAGVADRVLFYTVPVCERLVKTTADYDRAERLLQQALSLGETSYRAVLLRQLGDAARLRGQYEAAASHYQASLSAPRDDGAAIEHIQALNGLGKTHMQHGDYPRAMDAIERAIQIAHEGQHPAQHADVLMTLGTLALRQGDNDAAAAHFSEGLRMYRELGSSPGIADALQNLAGVASIRANHPDARAFLEQGLALFSEMGSRQQMAGILNNLGTAALQQGDFKAARPYYESSLSIRREIGDRNGIGATLSNLAILTLRQGNLAEAQTFGEASLQERRAIGDKRGITNSLSILAVITYDQNDDAGAQHYFEEILEMQRAINDRWGMATTLGNLGEIAGFAGRFPEAHAYLQEGLALYRQLDQPLGLSDTLVGQGDVAYEQGNSAAARALFEEALDIKRKINDQKGVALCLTALAYLEAESGALAAAERQLVDALALLRELDLGELPRALATLAATRRTMGQSGESIYPLVREALTLKQARTSLRRMLLTLIEVARVLLQDERYATLGELIGLLLKHNISFRSRQTVTQLLDEVRPHLDAAVLDAALERGGTSDVDAVVADVLNTLE